jgi:hypothetical protein
MHYLLHPLPLLGLYNLIVVENSIVDFDFNIHVPPSPLSLFESQSIIPLANGKRIYPLPNQVLCPRTNRPIMYIDPALHPRQPPISTSIPQGGRYVPAKPPQRIA